MSFNISCLISEWSYTNQLCRCHIFYSRRAVEIPDGKPKWSELDDSSELLDDSGNPKKGES